MMAPDAAAAGPLCSISHAYTAPAGPPGRNQRLTVEPSDSRHRDLGESEGRSGRRRVLVFGATTPSVGGIATFISHTVNSRLRERFDFFLFDPSQHAPKGKTVLSKAIFKSVAWLRYLRVLKKHAPEIVHMHTSGYTGFWITAVFLFVTAIFPAKIVIHIHRGDFAAFYKGSSWLGKWLIGCTLRRCSRVVILSKRWIPFFGALASPSGIRVLQNCVPVDGSTRSARTCRRVEGPWPQSVLFMGTLCRAKGVLDLAKAIPIVRATNPGVIFTFAGEPPTEADKVELDRLTADGVADGYVTFLGIIAGRTKLERLLQSDIFVLPSYSEGLPYAMMEAMASGLPIVASAVGAIPDVVTDHANGFLIQSGDHVSLANKILLLLNNHSLRRDIGTNNRRKIAEQYNIDTMINQLEELYAGI